MAKTHGRNVTRRCVRLGAVLWCQQTSRKSLEANTTTSQHHNGPQNQRKGPKSMERIFPGHSRMRRRHGDGPWGSEVSFWVQNGPKHAENRLGGGNTQNTQMDLKIRGTVQNRRNEFYPSSIGRAYSMGTVLGARTLEAVSEFESLKRTSFFADLLGVERSDSLRLGAWDEGGLS